MNETLECNKIRSPPRSSLQPSRTSSNLIINGCCSDRDITNWYQSSSDPRDYPVIARSIRTNLISSIITSKHKGLIRINRRWILPSSSREQVSTMFPPIFTEIRSNKTVVAQENSNFYSCKKKNQKLLQGNIRYSGYIHWFLFFRGASSHQNSGIITDASLYLLKNGEQDHQTEKIGKKAQNIFKYTSITTKIVEGTRLKDFSDHMTSLEERMQKLYQGKLWALTNHITKVKEAEQKHYEALQLEATRRHEELLKLLTSQHSPPKYANFRTEMFPLALRIPTASQVAVMPLMNTGRVKVREYYQHPQGMQILMRRTYHTTIITGTHHTNTHLTRNQSFLLSVEMNEGLGYRLVSSTLKFSRFQRLNG